VSDGIRLPVGDETADAAITAHTIYFWPEPVTTMGEIHRVLRPGGRLVIAFRAGEEDAPARLDPAVYDFHDTDTVVGFVEGAGFVDVEVATRPDVEPHYRWITAKRAT
jgi:ubiquinone/menaquinone biosynthesis C-methylase UbiE